MYFSSGFSGVYSSDENRQSGDLLRQLFSNTKFEDVFVKLFRFPFLKFLFLWMRAGSDPGPRVPISVCTKKCCRGGGTGNGHRGNSGSGSRENVLRKCFHPIESGIKSHVTVAYRPSNQKETSHPQLLASITKVHVCPKRSRPIARQ